MTCGWCKNNMTCDHVTGVCQMGCQAGYHGHICTDGKERTFCLVLDNWNNFNHTKLTMLTFSNNNFKYKGRGQRFIIILFM